MNRAAFLAVWLALWPAAAQQKVNQSALVFKDFSQRVADYLKIQKTANGQLHGLKPTNSPEKIEHHEHELAERIRKARTGAKPGDVFTPEVTAEFRRLIGETLHGPEGARIRASLQSASPVAPRAVRVNGAYGQAVPLQTTPPSLLLNLPELPQGVDYRVVGRALVLRDTEANLIVDFIPDVIQ